MSDKYLEVKQANQIQGLLRVVLYLEDMGLASPEESKGAVKAKTLSAAPRQAGAAPGQNPVED